MPPCCVLGCGEIVQRDAFIVPVAELALYAGCFLARGDGLIEPARMPQASAQLGERIRFLFAVADHTGNQQREVGEPDPVAGETTQFEVPPEPEEKGSSSRP